MKKSRAVMERKSVWQLSVFDQQDLVELHDPEQPGRHLVACRNPPLAEDRVHKCEALLSDTERELARIAKQVQAGRLKQAAAIGLAVGKVINRRNVEKHFQITIDDGVFTYERNAASIEKEAVLDGVYVVVTNVPQEKLSGCWGGGGID